jgi:hypothetical protein
MTPFLMSDCWQLSSPTIPFLSAPYLGKLIRKTWCPIPQCWLEVPAVHTLFSAPSDHHEEPKPLFFPHSLKPLQTSLGTHAALPRMLHDVSDDHFNTFHCLCGINIDLDIQTQFWAWGCPYCLYRMATTLFFRHERNYSVYTAVWHN